MNNSIGYFQEHVDSQQKWLSTELCLTQQTTPFYQIYTGGAYKRFMLATSKFKCYWGQFLRSDYAYFAGIRLWRNDIDISPEDMPIPIILSADIEQYKQKITSHYLLNHYQYWANFYAQQLLKSQRHFLHRGHWKIYPLYFNGQEKNNPTSLFNPISTTILDNIHHHAQYFNWNGFPFEHAITLKNMPNPDNGRVKWWRKKIVENTCPPILFWWHQHIQSFVLVDGHARLCAYQLEHKCPVALCITAINYHHFDNNTPTQIKERLNILSNLKKSLEKKEQKQEDIDIQAINQLLIKLYDDNSYESLTSLPKVISHLDEIYERDLQQLLLDSPENQVFLQLLLNTKH